MCFVRRHRSFRKAATNFRRRYTYLRDWLASGRVQRPTAMLMHMLTGSPAAIAAGTARAITTGMAISMAIVMGMEIVMAMPMLKPSILTS
mmetsp:Transcript_16335/g.28622  ORF Transcript_16335/g.28622 Transcript_16335/m.28622 type:complete len:90 (+) Transcript_16335:1377-1646(+)